MGNKVEIGDKVRLFRGVNESFGFVTAVHGATLINVQEIVDGNVGFDWLTSVPLRGSLEGYEYVMWEPWGLQKEPYDGGIGEYTGAGAIEGSI